MAIDRDFFNKLFIFEMANNHMADMEHGARIMKEFHEVCKGFDYKFAFKFQYRNIDTFIHPDYKERMDIKYVKRFMETNITNEQKKFLKDEATKLGFYAICTPFDEKSVDLIEEHDFDVIKIASCSFTDWPLLERIAQSDKPIIASTAGAVLEDIDKVVSFFEHRGKLLSLMHCVGEYPTKKENSQLNQIDLLKNRYPNVTVGYSTHEAPDNTDAVKIAVGKGAKIFERHVGFQTDKYALNAYSSSPEQVAAWLRSAEDAFVMCGISDERFGGTDKERSDLRGLQRGVFVKDAVKKGEKIVPANTFYAIPNIDDQVVANETSKYIEYTANRDFAPNEPVLFNDVSMVNLRGKVLEIVNKVKDILVESKIALPNRMEMEISHHYGIDKFYEWGATIINCINREYCKKLIILLPGQNHPIHYHSKKEETFHVLFGDMGIHLDGEDKKCKAGEMVIVERDKKHSFSSEDGAIFEEISTTHYKDDSFYDDENVKKNKNRKTALTFWSDWLLKPIS